MPQYLVPFTRAFVAQEHSAGRAPVAEATPARAFAFITRVFENRARCRWKFIGAADEDATTLG